VKSNQPRKTGPGIKIIAVFMINTVNEVVSQILKLLLAVNDEEIEQ
jgi:hypothetical protein